MCKLIYILNCAGPLLFRRACPNIAANDAILKADSSIPFAFAASSRNAIGGGLTTGRQDGKVIEWASNAGRKEIS